MTPDQERAAAALEVHTTFQMQRLPGGGGRTQKMLYRDPIAASFGASGGPTGAGASAQAGLGSGSAAAYAGISFFLTFLQDPNEGLSPGFSVASLAQVFGMATEATAAEMPAVIASYRARPRPE